MTQYKLISLLQWLSSKFQLMQCMKNRMKEIRIGLPSRKRSFNVISLTHIPHWVISILALTFRTSCSTSLICKQTFCFGSGLSSTNKSKSILWSSKPISSFFLPMSTTQLVVNINGLPKIKGMSLSSQISITTKSAGKIKCFTLTKVCWEDKMFYSDQNIFNYSIWSGNGAVNQL